MSTLSTDLIVNQSKLWSIGLLHMGHSFPGALAAVALPAIFRQNGLPLELFWLFALPLIPSWLRWLVAMLVDNYGNSQFGFRKSWIVPCTALGATFYLLLAYIEPIPANLTLIIGLLMLKSTIMTAQDVAVDGLAVESMTAAERSLGSAIIVYLMFMGTVAAQGLVAGVNQFGWRAMMLAAAALLIVVALPSSLRQEAPAPGAAAQRRRLGQSASIFEFLRRPESKHVMSVLLFIGLSSNFLRAMLPVFLVDIGLSLVDIGITFGTAVVVGTGAAALLIPKLSKSHSRRSVATLIALGYAPCAALFYLMSTTEVTQLFVALALSYVMFISTAVWIVVMEARLAWSSKHQAATDFSAQSSCASLGEWAGASIAGFVAASLGWTGFFWLGWGLSALALVAFIWANGPIEKRLTYANQIPANDSLP